MIVFTLASFLVTSTKLAALTGIVNLSEVTSVFVVEWRVNLPFASIFVLPVIIAEVLFVSLTSAKSTVTISAPVTTTFVASTKDLFVDFELISISLALTVASFT